MIRHSRIGRALAAALAATSVMTAAPPRALVAQGAWEALAIGTTASFRGLRVVSDEVIWASGTRGTVIRTTDGGAHWSVDAMPGGTKLDLRAIAARDARVAHAAATAGRIWRTTDGGKSWSLRYAATDTTVFLDAIGFWDDRHGMALGDPMRGRFFILTTDDGGDTWAEAPFASRPAADEGEAAFAASGTSLVLLTNGVALIGSGGGASARVHRSVDHGRSWRVFETPVRSGGSASGIFSLAFADAMHGIAVGGDYTKPDSSRASAAVTSDGGVTWQAATAPPHGYRSGTAVLRDGATFRAVAVGTNGADVSLDGGVTWQPLDAASFNAVQFTTAGTIFAVGDRGRVGRLRSIAPVGRPEP